MTKYWIGIATLTVALMFCLSIIFAGCSPTAATDVLSGSLGGAIENVTLHAGRSATVASADTATVSNAQSPANTPA